MGEEMKTIIIPWKAFWMLQTILEDYLELKKIKKLSKYNKTGKYFYIVGYKFKPDRVWR